MTDLISRDFVQPTAEASVLEGGQLGALVDQLGNGWQVVRGQRLEKVYRFANFRDALAFVNRVGELAEQVSHHPDIELGWGRVALTIWSHDAGGITEADFIWAARADALL